MFSADDSVQRLLLLSDNPAMFSSTPLRIVIIADDPLARAGLAALLAGEPGCQVIGQTPADAELAATLVVYRPDAVLWLLETKPEAKVNLRAEANARGIASERLIFAPHLPHDEHLARLQLVDLMLDTPQCNGGTTTADALVAGVPVLTCMGKTLAQRMAASMLSAANLESLITRNLEEYEALGLALLTDTGRLHGIRRELSNARASAPFFAPDRWIQSYEEALKHVWQMHCAGVPPTSFEARS